MSFTYCQSSKSNSESSTSVYSKCSLSGSSSEGKSQDSSFLAAPCPSSHHPHPRNASTSCLFDPFSYGHYIPDDWGVCPGGHGYSRSGCSSSRQDLASHCWRHWGQSFWCWNSSLLHLSKQFPVQTRSQHKFVQQFLAYKSETWCLYHWAWRHVIQQSIAHNVHKLLLLSAPGLQQQWIFNSSVWQLGEFRIAQVARIWEVLLGLLLLALGRYISVRNALLLCLENLAVPEIHQTKEDVSHLGTPEFSQLATIREHGSCCYTDLPKDFQVVVVLSICAHCQRGCPCVSLTFQLVS